MSTSKTLKLVLVDHTLEPSLISLSPLQPSMCRSTQRALAVSCSAQWELLKSNSIMTLKEISLIIALLFGSGLSIKLVKFLKLKLT